MVPVVNKTKPFSSVNHTTKRIHHHHHHHHQGCDDADDGNERTESVAEVFAEQK